MAQHLLRTANRLRNLTSLSVSCSHATKTRSIMTTKVKLDKALEELQKNPYFNKYAQKIAKFQETDPEQFLQRIETQEQKIKEKEEKQKRVQSSYLGKAKPHLETASQVQKAQLDSIMKLDMVQGKTKDEIVQIWKEYHQSKDCIAGVLSPEQYGILFNRGQKYPTFLLPLPRDQGYEFIVIQFSGAEIHMTPLIWYQTYKENAPECLTMVFYDDLKDEKGLVLMRGEFDKKYMTVQEAQCLANELQLFYSSDNPDKLQLLETFTLRPMEFKHMDLINQLENISFITEKKSSEGEKKSSS